MILNKQELAPHPAADSPMYCVRVLQTGDVVLLRDAEHVAATLAQFRELSIEIVGNRPGMRTVTVDVPSVGNVVNLTYGARNVIRDLPAYLEDDEQQRLEHLEWEQGRDVPTRRQLFTAVVMGIVFILRGATSGRKVVHGARYLGNLARLLRGGLINFDSFCYGLRERPIGICGRGGIHIVDPGFDL